MPRRRPLGRAAEKRMKLGYFTMPVHPPARRYVETLKEDRDAFILADRLGYSEGYCGDHRSDAEALGLLDADRNDMFAEAIDHILALWTGTAPIDLKGKYWTISTVSTLWPEVGIGDIVKPYQKPHPPIAGTATDPDSKGLIALGRRGWWPISSHFLHPNRLKSQWA